MDLGPYEYSKLGNYRLYTGEGAGPVKQLETVDESGKWSKVQKDFNYLDQLWAGVNAPEYVQAVADVQGGTADALDRARVIDPVSLGVGILRPDRGLDQTARELYEYTTHEGVLEKSGLVLSSDQQQQVAWIADYNTPAAQAARSGKKGMGTLGILGTIAAVVAAVYTGGAALGAWGAAAEGGAAAAGGAAAGGAAAASASAGIMSGAGAAAGASLGAGAAASATGYSLASISSGILAGAGASALASGASTLSTAGVISTAAAGTSYLKNTKDALSTANTVSNLLKGNSQVKASGIPGTEGYSAGLSNFAGNAAKPQSSAVSFLPQLTADTSTAEPQVPTVLIVAAVAAGVLYLWSMQ